MGGSSKRSGTSDTGNTVTSSNFSPEGFGKELGASAQNAFRAGGNVFNKPLYAGMGAHSYAGLNSLYNTAKGSQGMFDGATDFAQGLISKAGAPSLTETNLRNVANGGYLRGANPYFEANLAKAKDNTYADVMASLGGSGRTGSTVHMDELTGALGNLENSARGAQYETERDRQMQALAAIEGTRQQGIANAGAGMAALPGLYEASQQPGQDMLSVGQIRDADAQAKLMADYDLSQRKDPFNNISRYMSLMNGAQGTQGIAAKAPETPWWQQALGGAIGIAGAFL